MQKKSNQGEGFNDAHTADFMIGHAAGGVLLSPALNPHHAGTAAHEYWRQGHGTGTQRDLFGRKAGRLSLVPLAPEPTASANAAFRAIPLLSCAA